MADTTHVGLSVTGDAEIKRLSDRVETLTKSLGQQILKADKLEKASARLHTTYKSTEKTSTSLTSAANKLSPGLDRVGKSADNTSDEFGRLERELKQSNKNFVALGGIVEKQTQQLNGYKGKLAQVTNEKRKFNKESKKGIDTSRQLEGAFRGAAGGVGKLWLAYGALVPMIAGFGVATLTKEINRLGASFEYMTKYSASLSDNSVSLDEIRDSLLGIKGVAKTPTELADGYLELIKAGVSAESALLDIETAAKYATVGELELGTATQQLVTITKAFEKSSRNASGGMLTVADTADIVAYAAQKSTASFGDMQTAFTYMTSLASIANVTLQESAAALMIMHDAGLKGSLGATSLRTAITRLINPNEKARKSFAELGGNINAIFDDKGNIKNIQSMMIELKRLKDTVSDKKWSEFSFASFGLRGMNINVMVDELAKLDTNLKDIGESMGFVDKVFNDVSETAEITAANLKASFEKALIRAFDGERATEVLTNLDKLISSESFQGSVIDLADGMYSVAEAAVALAPALTLVTTPLGWFADVIQTSSFGYKAIAAEMRGDAVAIAELAAAYNNITLTESDRYSILESEIVRVKTAIYETNKAMSEAGTNSALIATATADLRSELVRLETSYSTLEDTVYDRSLEGVKTPLEFAMLGIAAAADKAVASVAAMPDYTADIARTEFTPTPSLNPYANFQQAKSPDSLDDQWAAFEKKEADQKKAKEKAAKTSARLAKKQAKAAEKQIEKAIENVERRIKAGQKLDSEQANWVKNSNDREQELTDVMDEGDGSLSRKNARLNEINSTFAALASTLESDYLRVEKQYIKVLDDSTLGEAERTRVLAERTRSTAAYTAELAILKSAQEVYIENDREMILSSGSFWDGMKLGLEDYTNSLTTISELGVSIFTDMSTAAGDSLGIIMTGLLDNSKTTWEELEALWESLWKGMLNTVIDTVADMAAEFVITEVAAAFFHTGSMGLKEDEYNAVLQKGEIVIPNGPADAIRDNLGPAANFEGIVDSTAEFGSQINSTGSLAGPSAAERLGEVAGSVVGRFSPMVGGITTPGAATVGTAIGGAVGALGAGSLADAMDARSFEGLRDALESGIIGETEAQTFKSEETRLGIDRSTKLSRAMVAADVMSSRVDQHMADIAAAARNALADHGVPGFRDDYEIDTADAADQRAQDAADQYNSTRPSPLNDFYGTERDPGGTGGQTQSEKDEADSIGFSSFAKGGIVNRLVVPRGDDGYAALALGEGVIDKDTMKVLSSAIRSATSGGTSQPTQELTIPIYIGDKYLTTTIVTIADKQITMRQDQGNPRGVTRI